MAKLNFLAKTGLFGARFLCWPEMKWNFTSGSNKQSQPPALTAGICAMCRPRRRELRDIILVKAGWISFSLALDQGPGALAPLDYYYAPGCGGIRMVKRFMLTPCWAGGINSGTVLTPSQTGATRCCGSKAYLSSAATEPLEVSLRALFGHSRRTRTTIAVNKPLEPTLRAQLGRTRKT